MRCSGGKAHPIVQPYYAYNVIFVSKDYPHTKNTIDVFDSEVFWDRLDEWSKNNFVFVSEYQAPFRYKAENGERDETLWTK